MESNICCPAVIEWGHAMSRIPISSDDIICNLHAGLLAPGSPTNIRLALNRLIMAGIKDVELIICKKGL